MSMDKESRREQAPIWSVFVIYLRLCVASTLLGRSIEELSCLLAIAQSRCFISWSELRPFLIIAPFKSLWRASLSSFTWQPQGLAPGLMQLRPALIPLFQCVSSPYTSGRQWRALRQKVWWHGHPLAHSSFSGGLQPYQSSLSTTLLERLRAWVNVKRKKFSCPVQPGADLFVTVSSHSKNLVMSTSPAALFASARGSMLILSELVLRFRMIVSWVQLLNHRWEIQSEWVKN